MNMSTTVRDDRTIDHRSGGPAGPPLAPPPKLRRRPGLVAAAVILIGLGGLLGAWAWTASTDSTEVLVARVDVARGSVIEAEDLARVQIRTDPALDPLPGSALDTVVGKRAALDIADAGAQPVCVEVITGDEIPMAGGSMEVTAIHPWDPPRPAGVELRWQPLDPPQD